MADEDLKGLLDAMRQENAAAHAETRRQFGNAANRLSAESRTHFEATAERLEKRFDLLAESVEYVKGELQRTRTTLDEKIERTAAETQAMIKFSHKELDRRVSTLEETVADLQTRVQRLETGTH